MSDRRGVGAVVALNARPQSVWYRAYEQIVEEHSVLLHCVRALRRAQNIESVIILVHDQEEARRVGAVLPPLQYCEVLSADELFPVRRLAQYAAHNEWQHSVLVFAEHLLAPHGLLDYVIEEHCEKHSDWTVVSGVAREVAPYILSSKCLAACVELSETLGVSECSLAVAVLDKAIRDGLVTRVDGSSLSRLAVQWDVGEAAQVHAVSLHDRDDIEALRTVFSIVRSTPENESDYLLKTWRDVRTRRIHQTCDIGAFQWQQPKTMGRPRILYLSNSVAFSGAEGSLTELLLALPSDKYDKLALLSFQGELWDRLTKAAVPCLIAEKSTADCTVANFAFMHAIFSRLRPDIIHMNGFEGFPALAAAYRAQIPIIMHVRNGVLEEYAEYVYTAKKIIAVSEFLKNNVMRLCVPATKVHVVYDEVDVASFSPDSFDKYQSQQQLGLPNKSQIVTMIARFTENKRHDVMLHAFTLLREAIPNAHLILKGENSERSTTYHSVRMLLDTLGLSRFVTMISFVSDIRVVHAATDVLVLCSDNEGLGRCIVEAMAMSVPVIVTRHGGSSELVRQARCGLIVDNGDPRQLASALISLLNDATTRDAFGKAGRRYAAEHLTATASASTVETIYDSVLAEAPLT